MGPYQQHPGTFQPTARRGRPGITLLELTVVILVIMMLIGILFFGARAWKRGSDRAICIVQIQNVQKGVRSYSNLYGYDAGANVSNLKSQIIGLGRYVESEPTCPSSGTYEFGQAFGINTVPPMGELYMECSLEIDEEHLPPVTSDW